jgi:hypothetical protein
MVADIISVSVKDGNNQVNSRNKYFPTDLSVQVQKKKSDGQYENVTSGTVNFELKRVGKEPPTIFLADFKDPASSIDIKNGIATAPPLLARYKAGSFEVKASHSDSGTTFYLVVQPKWGWHQLVGIVLFIVVLIVDLLFVRNISYDLPEYFVRDITSIGLFTFTATLLSALLVQGVVNLNQKQVRRAIAVTLIALYLILLPVGLVPSVFGTETIFDATALTSFRELIGIILAFYFGGRSLEEAFKAWGKGKSANDDDDNNDDGNNDDGK